jgi:predicted methyltransferase
MNRTLVITFAFLVFAACGDEHRATTATPAETTRAPAAMESSVYQRAVDAPGRTDADRARDAGRKPAEVLAFFGIGPGMTVLDMFSGGGYYTELLSGVVGPVGKVIAHTNSAYAQFVGEEATNRYANNRLPNVEILLSENNELRLPDESFDATLMILAYHDIYYVDPDNGWPRIDGAKLVEELYRGLKPGGILGVVDHFAAPGSGRETGNTLHRIDPGIVIEELEAAGFVLDGQSEALRNANDDHSLNMAAPEVRGRTDRFILRFRKPG